MRMHRKPKREQLSSIAQLDFRLRGKNGVRSALALVIFTEVRKSTSIAFGIKSEQFIIEKRLIRGFVIPAQAGIQMV